MTYRRRLLVFIPSFLAFLLISCTTISPLDGPRSGVDLTLSEEYYEQAVSVLEEKNIGQALILLLRSLGRNPDNERALTLFESINGSLVSEAHFIKEPITRGRGLERPLNFFLYYVVGEEVYPVPDIPVRFEFLSGTGELTEEAVTSDAGLAKCYVERIDTYEKGVTVEAVPFLDYDGKRRNLEHLAQRYVFSNVSLLEQTQHVYLLFDNSDRELNSNQFSHIKNSFIGLFHENEFNDVEFHYMTEEILFNRALQLDRPSINVLSDADMLFLVRVKTAFISQQSVDFFFSNADILLQVVDTKALSVMVREQVSRRGAGKTRALSADQAVVNAVSDISRQLDLFLKEVRSKYGV
jgi:hypothetical protein